MRCRTIGILVLQIVKVLLKILIPYFLGLLIASAVGKIPSKGGLPFISVNPLTLGALIITCIMIWKLLPSMRRSKYTFVTLMSTVSIYTLFVYLIAVDTPESVTFDTRIMSFLTLPIYTLAVLPFVAKQHVICFQKERAERDSVFLAASIMWLSPSLAEILVLLRWYVQGNLWNRLNYMVLGGNGTNDVLFFYGFWAFLSVNLFHFFSEKGVCGRYLKHELQK